MNAPVLSVLPAEKQREYDEARAWFREQHAKHLSYLQNAGIGPFAYAMPDQLTWEPDYDKPHWLALAEVEGTLIEGEHENAHGALAAMMKRAEAVASDLAQERYEDNMAGGR